MNETSVEVYDQGAAAYLLFSGVRMLGVRFTGTLASYEFENRDGQAVAGLKEWRRGTVQVPARDYLEAFRAVMSVTKKMSRPASAEGVVHGARYEGRVA